jgi:hypothetical protein
MSELLTITQYESNFLADDWDEDDDVELVAYTEAPFDPETQVRLRYGFGTVNVDITEENKDLPLRTIIEQHQATLSFRNINEISARNESGFIDQNAPPVVGSEYVLAAIGDSKGVLV